MKLLFLCQTNFSESNDEEQLPNVVELSLYLLLDALLVDWDTLVDTVSEHCEFSPALL